MALARWTVASLGETDDIDMELAANVWPIADNDTKIVTRFLARAYAFEASDDAIARTLEVLSATDYLLARMFRIPEHLTLVSQFGSLRGAVELSVFHEMLHQLVEPALMELEADYLRIQGFRYTDPEAEPVPVIRIPRFPKEPYLVVTTVLDMDDGTLRPVLDKGG